MVLNSKTTKPEDVFLNREGRSKYNVLYVMYQDGSKTRGKFDILLKQ